MQNLDTDKYGNGSLFLRDVEVTGSVKSSGDVYLEGKINGDVKCNGRVIIRRHALIEGDVECRELVISGTIRGNVIVDGIANLKCNSKIEGYAIASRFILHPDASVEQGIDLKETI